MDRRGGLTASACRRAEAHPTSCTNANSGSTNEMRPSGYFRVDRSKHVVADSFGEWIYGKTCMNGTAKITLKMEEHIQNRSVNGPFGRLGQACRHGASIANGADVRRRPPARDEGVARPLRGGSEGVQRDGVDSWENIH